MCMCMCVCAGMYVCVTLSDYLSVKQDHKYFEAHLLS